MKKNESVTNLNFVVSHFEQNLGPLRKQGDRFLGFTNKDYSKWLILSYKEIVAIPVIGLAIASAIHFGPAILGTLGL